MTSAEDLKETASLVTPDESTPATEAPAQAQANLPLSLNAIYDQLNTYPFYADQEFLLGLASILGHPDTPPSPDELLANKDLVLRARCFYLTRKLGLVEPIDPEKYEEWTRSQRQAASWATGPVGETAATSAVDTPTSSSQSGPPITISPASRSSTLVAPNPDASQEPPYPTSFAAIVDLITRNLPIPGIEEIPPTVLEPGTSKIDKTPRRKKPWEKDDAQLSSEEGEGTAEAKQAESTSAAGPREEHPGVENSRPNGHFISGQGVVKILQPNAIPDSGLLGKE